jgi:hypothetical protein
MSETESKKDGGKASSPKEKLASKVRRARDNYTFIFTSAVVLLLFLADPDSGLIQNLPFGASAVATIIVTLRPVIIITLIHYTRKWIFDYVDLGDIYEKVMKSRNATSQALFALAMAVFTLAFSLVFAIGGN